jgi:hypothetical protein
VVFMRIETSGKCGLRRFCGFHLLLFSVVSVVSLSRVSVVSLTFDFHLLFFSVVSVVSLSQVSEVSLSFITDVSVDFKGACDFSGTCSP